MKKICDNLTLNYFKNFCRINRNFYKFFQPKVDVRAGQRRERWDNAEQRNKKQENERAFLRTVPGCG